jgi:hypothetical protein
LNIEEGTIFRKRNIVFKETNQIDTRMNSHPVLIPIDVDFDSNYIYFFTISSQIQYYTRDKNRYYLLKQRKGTGIKKTSLIDLKHVYKSENSFPIPDGFLHPKEVESIRQQFKSYTNLNTDSDCQELLSFL